MRARVFVLMFGFAACGGGGDKPTGPVLQPGGGFAGATEQPPATGSGPGADKQAIAHWDVVPYQTVDDALSVGVLAYHINEIDRVEFSLDGGPWVAIAAATHNAATDADEFQATFDASLVADGPHEIRAIAYPTAGIPRVLQGDISNESSSLFLSANHDGSLPHEIRYVATTGSDTNDCTTAANACATIAHAISTAATPNHERALDGAEIRLGAGTWQLPELADGSAPGFTTTDRWLTITHTDGTSPADVKIDGIAGPDDGAGMWLKQIHLDGVTVIQPVDKTPVAFEDYLWYDHSTLESSDPDTISMGHCFSWHGYGAFTGTFYTDLVMRNSCDGPRDATLARNVFAEETGGGHSSGTATVVNYSVKMIYGSGYPFPSGPGPDYHGDIYQMFGRQADVIIYHAFIVPGGMIGARGIVGTAPGDQHDVVIDKVDLTTEGFAFSFCGNEAANVSLDHMIIKDSHFVGASDWCAEGNTTPDASKITNVLIDHSVFENGSPDNLPQPSDLPGIRYK